jgi:hypothetical protein
MPTRASELNSYRKREKSSLQIPTLNPMNLGVTMPHFFPYSMLGYPSYMSLYPLMPGIQYKPPSLIISNTNPVPKCMDPINVTVPLLPPEEVDPVDRMYLYFNWLSSKSPLQMGMLLDMKNSLLDAGYNFNMMFHILETK